MLNNLCRMYTYENGIYVCAYMEALIHLVMTVTHEVAGSISGTAHLLYWIRCGTGSTQLHEESEVTT